MSANKFYTYNQNNSGGVFDFDPSGVTHIVIVEATSADKANGRAQEIGLYFDGCDNGMDCPCCGNRWSRAWEDDGKDVPSYYDDPIKGYNIRPAWMKGKPESVIHYFDGRIEWIDENGNTCELPSEAK